MLAGISDFGPEGLILRKEMVQDLDFEVWTLGNKGAINPDIKLRRRIIFTAESETQHKAEAHERTRRNKIKIGARSKQNTRYGKTRKSVKQ